MICHPCLNRWILLYFSVNTQGKGNIQVHARDFHDVFAYFWSLKSRYFAHVKLKKKNVILKCTNRYPPHVLPEQGKQKQSYHSYSPNGWRYIMFTNEYFAVDRSLLKESMNIPYFSFCEQFFPQTEINQCTSREHMLLDLDKLKRPSSINKLRMWGFITVWILSAYLCKWWRDANAWHHQAECFR